MCPHLACVSFFDPAPPGAVDVWLEMDETRKHADWDASGVLRLLGRWAAGLGKPEARARAQDHHGVRKTSNGAHMACPSQRAWA